jgi:hypothetical protein
MRLPQDKPIEMAASLAAASLVNPAGVFIYPGRVFTIPGPGMGPDRRYPAWVLQSVLVTGLKSRRC